MRVTKKGNFTPSAFSPPAPHRHFSSKMAVCLPTPKVNLSESILDPTEIPGLDDIWITHLDVTTDFDWPEMVPRQGGSNKTVASVNGFSKPRRLTIALTSLHLQQMIRRHLVSLQLEPILCVSSIPLPFPTAQQGPQRESIAAGHKHGLSPAFVWPTGKPIC